MEYSFAFNLYDKDGDKYEDCILVFIGKDTIIKFRDSVELEQFANRILNSIKELREGEIIV
jgi:hypothetical protein